MHAEYLDRIAAALEGIEQHLRKPTDYARRGPPATVLDTQRASLGSPLPYNDHFPAVPPDPDAVLRCYTLSLDPDLLDDQIAAVEEARADVRRGYGSADADLLDGVANLLRALRAKV